MEIKYHFNVQFLGIEGKIEYFVNFFANVWDLTKPLGKF